MNDNETLNRQEDAPAPAEDTNATPHEGSAAESLTTPTSNLEEQNPDGFSFDLVPLCIAVAFCVFGAVSDWKFYMTLAIAVIIHELGHVIFGKAFGCGITKMQVFFFTFLSYKPKQIPGGSQWRDITWCLGVLPWGGYTTFKNKESDVPTLDMYERKREKRLTVAESPYINDKPAWQRLLISAAGVLFNFITVLVVYLALAYLPFGGYSWVINLAQLSLLLAVLNIVPIYPLDGGLVLFTIYEMATGKKPSAQFTKWCGFIGFLAIILCYWVFPHELIRMINNASQSLFSSLLNLLF